MWYVHIRNTTECKRSERCAQNISNAEPWGVEFGRCWWGGEHFHFKIVHTKKNKKQSTYNLRKRWNKIKSWKGLSLLWEMVQSEVCGDRLQRRPRFAVRPALARAHGSLSPGPLAGLQTWWVRPGTGVRAGGWLSVPSGWSLRGGAGILVPWAATVSLALGTRSGAACESGFLFWEEATTFTLVFYTHIKSASALQGNNYLFYKFISCTG